MTITELYGSFCKQALLEWSSDNISRLWVMIEPYFDKSKFISQDEKDFEEWYSSSFPDRSPAFKSDLKISWIAARKK